MNPSIKRNRILAVLPALIPSTILGVIKPLFELQKNGEIEFRVVLNQLCREANIRWADMLVMCRNCSTKDLRILFGARKFKKKIVYEIDDNFFNISIDTELGRYHRNPVRLFALRKIFENSDAVHVYSDSLYEIGARYNPNVKKIRSYFDLSLVAGLTRRKHDGIVKVAYSTSRIGQDAVSVIYESALRQILEMYPYVHAHIWGVMPSRLKGLANAKLMNYEPNYHRFIRAFYEEGFDIGLAPMFNDEFHRSKTNNKFREYGGCEVAGVYSDVPLYSECVQDGVSGLLVNNCETEWREAIERLVVDPQLRDRIRHSAREYVAKHYSFDNAVSTWRQTISEVVDKVSRQTFCNGLIFRKISAVILLDEASQHYSKFNPSRLNLLLEALDGLQSRKCFTVIPQNASQQTVTSLVEDLQNHHNLLICMARDRRLRGYCLKSSSSATVPFCVDFADDSLVEEEQPIDYKGNNLFVISARQTELKNVGTNSCISELSPKDREIYYSLDSPVCQWMELIFSLRLVAPGQLSHSGSVLAFFNHLTGFFIGRFLRLRNYVVILLRYGKQVGIVLSMNMRKRY